MCVVWDWLIIIEMFFFVFIQLGVLKYDKLSIILALTNLRRKKAYSTMYSQAVTHPSTNTAQPCLTSVIGRELVYLGGAKNRDTFIEEQMYGLAALPNVGGRSQTRAEAGAL